MFQNSWPFYRNILKFAFCNIHGIFHRLISSFLAQFIVFELLKRKAEWPDRNLPDLIGNKAIVDEITKLWQFYMGEYHSLDKNLEDKFCSKPLFGLPTQSHITRLTWTLPHKHPLTWSIHCDSFYHTSLSLNLIQTSFNYRKNS